MVTNPFLQKWDLLNASTFSSLENYTITILTLLDLVKPPVCGWKDFIHLFLHFLFIHFVAVKLSLSQELIPRVDWEWGESNLFIFQVKVFKCCAIDDYLCTFLFVALSWELNVDCGLFLQPSVLLCQLTLDAVEAKVPGHINFLWGQDEESVRVSSQWAAEWHTNKVTWCVWSLFVRWNANRILLWVVARVSWKGKIVTEYWEAAKWAS